MVGSSNQSQQEQEPRLPRNLAGIINWSSSLQQQNDGTQPSQFTEMDPARREFLRQAFDSLTVDEAKQMMENLKTLSETSSDNDLAKREVALDDLQMLVETIDNASDLYKIGGWPVLLKLLGDPAPSVRAGSANVLATALQNNPQVQAYALETDTLELLTALLSDEDKNVRKKAMYAISALVREFAPSHKVFLHKGGLEILKGTLADEEQSVRIKSLFLLRHLCFSVPSCRDQLRENGTLETILALVTEDDRTVREQALSSLLYLMEDNAANQAVCADPKNNLRANLDAIVNVAASAPAEEREEMEEELGYVATLRAVCFAA